MHIKADILQEYRKPFNEGHIHVGWCRVAQAWRWRVLWDWGTTTGWSVSGYKSRTLAHEVALSALYASTKAA